ncbi:MAG: hypothetical protein RRA92_07775 [Gemmatimonadota bacterium]|nr:hypothetical protein [Gemmatimonadota bacterium]
MNDGKECEVLHRTLDAFDDLAADGDALRELERHAAECPACAALLRVRGLLAAPPQQDLEVAAPDLYVRGMWQAVRGAVPRTAATERPRDAPEARRPGAGRGRQLPAWSLAGGLAAAAVALAVLAGGLAVERTRLVERQAVLAERLAEQERRLAALEATGRGATTAALSVVAAAPWERALAAEETVTLGRLRDLLAVLPPRTTLLDAAEVQALATAPPPGASSVAEAWPRAAPHLDLADGLQAGELRAALEALDLADQEPVPAARLLAIYRDARRAARS